jgi:hypothetical protein
MTKVTPIRRPLTVRHAEIKTAAVEIKSLTITGKQVTLAVFRQLLEEQLIDEDTGNLFGVPWGTVNYCPNKDCGNKSHWHTVWQKGTELRRSTNYKVPKHGPHDRAFCKDSGNAAYAAEVRENFRGTDLAGVCYNLNIERNEDSRKPYGEKRLPAELQFQPYQELDHRIFSLLTVNEFFRRRDGGYALQQESERKHQIDQLIREVTGGESMEQLLAEFDADIAIEVEARKTYLRSLNSLADLPQLFIAV